MDLLEVAAVNPRAALVFTHPATQLLAVAQVGNNKNYPQLKADTKTSGTCRKQMKTVGKLSWESTDDCTASIKEHMEAWCHFALMFRLQTWRTIGACVLVITQVDSLFLTAARNFFGGCAMDFVVI